METIMYVFAAFGIYTIAGMISTIIICVLLQKICNNTKRIAERTKTVADETEFIANMIKEESWYKKKKKREEELKWINRK